MKVGDVVTLKSGGPKMTVQAIKASPESGDLNVLDVIYTLNGRFTTRTFPEAVVMVFEEPAKGKKAS